MVKYGVALIKVCVCVCFVCVCVCLPYMLSPTIGDSLFTTTLGRQAGETRLHLGSCINQGLVSLSLIFEFIC